MGWLLEAEVNSKDFQDKRCLHVMEQQKIDATGKKEDGD